MRLLTIMLLALSLLMPCAAFGETLGLETLAPIEMAAEGEAQTLDLFCGPTQGFYRRNEQTLDLSQPYVVFGQYDCWAMAAQGTAQDFGPVGWIEAGFLSDLSALPLLAFEDGLSAMIEETAPLTDDPLDASAAWDAALEPGTQVTLLAQYGDFVYVQAEIEDAPVRAFIPVSSVL